MSNAKWVGVWFGRVGLGEVGGMGVVWVDVFRGSDRDRTYAQMHQLFVSSQPDWHMFVGGPSYLCCTAEAVNISR